MQMRAPIISVSDEIYKEKGENFAFWLRARARDRDKHTSCAIKRNEPIGSRTEKGIPSSVIYGSAGSRKTREEMPYGDDLTNWREVVFTLPEIHKGDGY